MARLNLASFINAASAVGMGLICRVNKKRVALFAPSLPQTLLPDIRPTPAEYRIAAYL